MKDSVPIGRKPLAAMSGANSAERAATRQVFAKMCETAAALVAEKVGEYATRTHQKVVRLDTTSQDVDLGAFCTALEEAVAAEDGLLLIPGTMNREAGRAQFSLWIAPEYEGDLAGLFERKLANSGTGTSFAVELKVSR
jgi:hypothetical protein